MNLKHIRRAEAGDIDIIMDIWLHNNIMAHSYIPEEYWKNNYDGVKEAISKAEVYVYVDDVIKGFIGLQDQYIAGFFVKKEYRSSGIGHQLMEYVQAQKQQLTLSVYEKNQMAVKFYEKHGFVIADQDVDPDTHESEYLMRWRNE